jgi:crotonobetainyl-CoA:carnitine CoA-transferase CaiB-like acyl-CoA transferase
LSDLLEGVRVLELAVLLNGDYLGMLLGDLGADVIKIESPGRGDYLRDMLGQLAPHQSPAHVQVNKNKRSVTIDLRHQTGRDIFGDLVRTADVIVDGYVSGTCDALGIGYRDVHKIKPDIVYCHYSGFGATGPYASIPTHGQMMNALAAAVPVELGDDDLVRIVDRDEPMGGTRIGGDGSAAGGTHAAYHVAAALFRRERTGAGCYLDAAGADGVLANGWMGAVYGLNDHRIADRQGLRPRGQPAHQGAKYQWYETADHRFVLFCCIEHKFWARFCAVVDHPEWAGRTDQGGPVDFAHTDIDLRHQLQTVFRTRTQAEWVALAAREDLPIGPSHQGALALLDDDHLMQRTILLEGDHPKAGPFTYVGEPVVVDGAPYQLRRPAPGLGDHTDEILAELGYDPDRIASLRRESVI